MMRPKTLKRALLLAMASLVVVSGIIISQVVTHRYGTSLIQGATAKAENIAHKLALDATDKILINDFVSLQKLLDDQIASDPTVAYLFVVKDRQILAHTFASGVPVNLISANTLDSIDKGRLEKIVSDQNERYLDIAWPIFENRAGTLRLGLFEAPYRRQVMVLWVQISLMTLGILLLALFCCHLFVNRLTRPLMILTGAVEKIGEGNLETRVDVKGRDEVNKLTSAFNGMLDRIKEYTSQLKITNQELEKKNLELDRTHRQLQTSFRISQEIAPLANLKEVCSYLLKTFTGIVECKDMMLIVFSKKEEVIFIHSKNKHNLLDKEAFSKAYVMFRDLKSISFVKKSKLEFVSFLEFLPTTKSYAMLPFHYQGELLGGIIISCPGECRCVTNELDILTMMLQQTAGAIKRSLKQEQEIRQLRAKVEATEEYGGLVGKDPKMHIIYKLIEDVAPTDATVLIQGESGTGKELVARAIHRKSARRHNPFVVINCSAYPETLLESELFGHEKGAFTGALRRKHGRFEQAHGGTVFLDEIGEISQSAQIKLLRVLQSQKFERLGGDQSLTIDIRILAATNKNLLQEVKNGNFREDLFYRLNVIPIHLPALMERRNDIPLLARHFLGKFLKEQEKAVQGFNSEAMRILLEYPWPGNVRELENSIEHAVVLAKGSLIGVSDLPSLIINGPVETSASINQTLMKTEEKLILDTLEECKWNKTEAAERLGISRSTLYEKLKKYSITTAKPTLH